MPLEEGVAPTGSQQGGSSGNAASAFRESCLATMASFRDRLRDEPGFNPVAQLAFQLSRDIEAGKHSLADLTALVKSIGRDALEDRAAAVREKVGEIDREANRVRLREALKAIMERSSAKAFERTKLGVIFTGHPTFVLSTGIRRALAKAATGGKASWPDHIGPDQPLTLVYEHAEALRALDTARDALFEVSRTAAELVRDSGDPEWRTATFGYVGLGTWIGYDLDGRTDIRWIDSFRFRLEEKLRQLERYHRLAEHCAETIAADPLAARISEFAGRLSAAAAYLRRRLDAFAADALDADRLSAAANVLTADHPDKITDITTLTVLLEELLTAADGPVALDLAALRSEMLTFGLGAGEIHIRINATQLNNAVRRHLDLDVDDTMAGRSVLEHLAELTRDVVPQQVNFASVDRETTTALRQFILAAQIVKHVDARASIRLLIAECESPITVVCGLYFARLFDVDRHLDISPLFETPKALENAARFFDVLFSVDVFRNAVRRRGRLAVQTGFSDSGRFMGQVPATLAIERLHGQLARAVEKHELKDIEVLTFETHGESVGRGGHPGTFLDRMLYLLSPWARAGFESRGIPLAHEVSFQGGDGYLWFETFDLAFAVLTRLLETEAEWRDHAVDDGLYELTNFSFDFFRRMAAFHARLLTDPAYHRVLGAFATGLLNDTGSRRSRRQFDIAGEQADQIRRVRAIPHNALLQQLGYPLNVIAGFGSALAGDEDRFVKILAGSERLRRITEAVVFLRRRASIKALAAHATLFDPNYWVTRPYAGAEPHLTEPCVFIAQLLERDDRASAIITLAVQMRTDVIRLHRTLFDAGIQIEDRHERVRGRLDLLHALRLALLQHIFLLAARVPRFSTRNDISREDIMQMVFGLRINEAVELLRDAYPVSSADPKHYHLDEKATYPDSRSPLYSRIVETLIDPMLDAHRTVLEIGVIIAQDFGAHG